jgi:hypothetical protein
MNRSNGQRRAARRLAAVAAGGFGAIAVFELVLAAGAPLGSAAWGGAHPGRLPPEFRAASALAAGFYLLAALTALARGGIAWSPIPYSFSRRGMWVLTALLAVGTVMNAASSSRWERFGWAPLILALAIVCLRLARSPDERQLPVTDAVRARPGLARRAGGARSRRRGARAA